MTFPMNMNIMSQDQFGQGFDGMGGVDGMGVGGTDLNLTLP